jgi:hypothetical protein
MPAANTPVYTSSIPPSVRHGCYNRSPVTGLLLEVESGRPEFPRMAPVHVIPAQQPIPQVRKWVPLPDPEPRGLGPSVAELTLGRPPRAPRPHEG